MLPWVVRVAWLVLPLSAGSTIAGALDDRSAAVQVTAAAITWAAWGAGVLALLVRRPAGLVVVRVAAVSAVPVVMWAADSATDWLVAGGHVVALAVLVLLPATGEWIVNGASYGDERRFVLRIPAAFALGPIELAALALPAATFAGPLLLAAQQWVAGALALAVGVPIAVVLFRALHAMTRRWAVLVPAGFVLKDHLVLGDPMLFRRGSIAVLQRALAGSDALDLTASALGGAIEVRLHEPQEIDRVISRGSIETIDVTGFLCSPTRPDALIRAASTRRIRTELLPSG